MSRANRSHQNSQTSSNSQSVPNSSDSNMASIHNENNSQPVDNQENHTQPQNHSENSVSQNINQENAENLLSSNDQVDQHHNNQPNEIPRVSSENEVINMNIQSLVIEQSRANNVQTTQLPNQSNLPNNEASGLSNPNQNPQAASNPAAPVQSNIPENQAGHSAFLNLNQQPSSNADASIPENQSANPEEENFEQFGDASFVPSGTNQGNSQDHESEYHQELLNVVRGLSEMQINMFNLLQRQMYFPADYGQHIPIIQSQFPSQFPTQTPWQFPSPFPSQVSYQIPYQIPSPFSSFGSLPQINQGFNSGIQHSNFGITQRITTRTPLHPLQTKFNGPLENEFGERVLKIDEALINDVCHRMSPPVFEEILSQLKEKENFINLQGKYFIFDISVAFFCMLQDGLSLSQAENRFFGAYETLRVDFQQIFKNLDDFVQLYTDIPYVYVLRDQQLFDYPDFVTNQQLRRVNLIGDNTHYAIVKRKTFSAQDFRSFKLERSGLSYFCCQTLKSLVFFISPAFPAALHDSPIFKSQCEKLISRLSGPASIVMDSGYEGAENWSHQKFPNSPLSIVVKMKEPQTDANYIAFNHQAEAIRGQIEKFFGNFGNYYSYFKEKRLFQMSPDGSTLLNDTTRLLQIMDYHQNLTEEERSQLLRLVLRHPVQPLHEKFLKLGVALWNCMGLAKYKRWVQVLDLENNVVEQSGWSQLDFFKMIKSGEMTADPKTGTLTWQNRPHPNNSEGPLLISVFNNQENINELRGHLSNSHGGPNPQPIAYGLFHRENLVEQRQRRMQRRANPYPVGRAAIGRSNGSAANGRSNGIGRGETGSQPSNPSLNQGIGHGGSISNQNRSNANNGNGRGQQFSLFDALARGNPGRGSSTGQRMAPNNSNSGAVRGRGQSRNADIRFHRYYGNETNEWT